MKRIALAVILVILCVSGCSGVEETYRPAYYEDDEDSEGVELPDDDDSIDESVIESEAASEAEGAAYDDGEIRELAFTSNVIGRGTVFTIDGVYAEGEFYSVEISNDDGEYRVKTYHAGEMTGLLKIEVPSGDSFLIMNSVERNLDYGCEVMSSLREFGDGDFPDLIELDFYIEGELEVPQYGRFFAVFDGELREVPIYENGAEVSPFGAHLELQSAGFMTQHLTISTGVPNEYEIAKYEYTFDTENRILNKKRVRFYGWQN